MTSITITPAGSKSPVDDLEKALRANERQGALIETIDEKFTYALDSMPAGDDREDELRRCWMLLWTVRETHDRLHAEMADAHEGILGERQTERKAA